MSGTNADDMIKPMNGEFINLLRWLNVNKFSLNVNKTDYVFISLGCKIVTSIKHLFITNVIVERVSSTSF